MIRNLAPFGPKQDSANGTGPPPTWLTWERITAPRLDEGAAVVFGVITCLVLLSIALAVNFYFGIVIVYTIPIALSAWLLGRRPALAVAAFSVFAVIASALHSPHGSQVLPVSLPALVLVSGVIIGGCEWARANETPLRQMAARERRHRQMLETLTKVGEELVAAKRIDAIAAHVLESLCRDLELDIAWMFHPHPRDNSRLQLLASSGAPPTEETISREAGIIGWAFARGERVEAASAQVSALINPTVERSPVEVGLEARLALPVFVRGQVSGVVLLGHSHPRTWETEEIRTAATVVNQLGLAMESANAHRAAIDAMVRLEEVNQMKSDFMKTVSHELRTPMTVVAGYIELMRDGSLGDVPASWGEPLALVRAKVGELNRLVQLMLEAARAEGLSVAVNLEEIDLVQFVSLAVEAEAGEVARQGRELRFDAPDQALPVRIDRNKVLVVLRNLIENAVKYSPEGGPIEVGVAMTDDTARVWVADRGIGARHREGQHLQPVLPG